LNYANRPYPPGTDGYRSAQEHKRLANYIWTECIIKKPENLNRLNSGPFENRKTLLHFAAWLNDANALQISS